MRSVDAREAATMKTRLISIGNSRGVRIPKSFLDQAGLEHDVELRVVGGGIMIRAVGVRRAGWTEAAERIRERKEGGLLDLPVATDFDESKWTW
jgi:antitoxin MazE